MKIDSDVRISLKHRHYQSEERYCISASLQLNLLFWLDFNVSTFSPETRSMVSYQMQLSTHLEILLFQAQYYYKIYEQIS